MAEEFTEFVTLRDGAASIDVAVKATPMASDGSVAGITITTESGSVLGVGVYAPALGYELPYQMLECAAAWACDIAHGSATEWGGRVSNPDPDSAPALALKRACRAALLLGDFDIAPAC